MGVGENKTKGSESHFLSQGEEKQVSGAGQREGMEVGGVRIGLIQGSWQEAALWRQVMRAVS